MEQVKVKKETKNKIKVDFERAPLSERLKAKFLSLNFLKKVVFLIFKLVLLVGVSYVILYPYIAKIFYSFMTQSDFKDVTVILISKNPSFDQYKYIITENHYFKALFNTFILSITIAAVQTIVCALVGYGLAKFKFKGNGLVFAFVILTMMVPQITLKFSYQIFFNWFSQKSVIGMLLHALGLMGEGFSNSLIPEYVLAITGLGFKNGLFIFMMRQFFRGVPDELEESAYVDGSTTMRTFFSIIIPLAVPMLVTVFIFSFAWQWTDDYYINIFFNQAYRSNIDSFKTLSLIATNIPPHFSGLTKNLTMFSSAIVGTSTILIVLPLIIVYLFVQKYIVQGIERSGIVG